MLKGLTSTDYAVLFELIERTEGLFWTNNRMGRFNAVSDLKERLLDSWENRQIEEIMLPLVETS